MLAARLGLEPRLTGPEPLIVYFLSKAGRSGLEPELTGPEPGVLPLDDLPALKTK